ncbi:glycine betaine ABC transporter substrate-binding protein [Haloglycomyces albus]|uniref:glycine betaine ABC transporter substrate-binding protein n=1 Tax=Haloglycomyces albus TaxID=526067 RepID=UPI00046CBAB6|nr:glycine betaine ABC transporter substrate-binding protein [Haloglycomyces albus]
MTYPPPGNNPPYQGPGHGYPGHPPGPPRRNYAAVAAIAAVAALVLFTGIGIGAYFYLGDDDDGAEISAPSSDESESGDFDDEEDIDDETDGGIDEYADAGFNVPDGTGGITIGYLAEWDENVVVSHMWKMALEDAGYDVELKPTTFPAVFSGLTTNNFDLYLNGTLPRTHGNDMDRYGDEVEDLGVWYDTVEFALAVPKYVKEVDSIEDLADHADLFDGEINGNEYNSGLATATDEVISTYDLDDFEQVYSSMNKTLKSLSTAIGQEEPIVVSLWKPHWAYGAYDLKDLDDPEGALGEPQKIHNLARDGFSGDFPEVAEAIESFYMTDEQLSDVLHLVFQEEEYEDDVGNGVLEWLRDNPFRELTR